MIILLWRPWCVWKALPSPCARNEWCFAIKHALALQLNKREEGVQLLFEYLMSFTFYKLLLFDLMIWLLVSLWNGTCTSRFSFMDSTRVCADAPRTETKHCVCGEGLVRYYYILFTSISLSIQWNTLKWGKSILYFFCPLHFPENVWKLFFTWSKCGF